MLDAANRLFPSMLLRNQGRHQHKDQLRLQKDTEHLAPEILISNSSLLTIIQEDGNINASPLTAAPSQNYNTDGLAIRLNRLKEKKARYN